jgi:class 3 adenylate cyclase/tetratricopeptide (TPR) repeat protein
MPTMREERRVVTVLFADVAGSTALGEQLDPEDVVEVVGGAVSRIVEVVEAAGGTVKDLAGDGVLAFWGAPVAHEDDPERAILAGLEIQRAVGEHASEVATSHGVQDFGVRVGIETGTVILGLVGGGSRVEYGVTGEAVNTAARLQTHAPIGGVLVGPQTRREAEDRFVWGTAELLAVKGKKDPVRASLVSEPSAPARSGRHVRIVGRTRELRVLDERLDALGRGDGQVVFVVGEAGIGKSRLLAELRAEAEGRTIQWMEGRCAPLDESTPFSCIRDLLERWVGAAGSEAARLLASRLDAQLDVAAVTHLATLLAADEETRTVRSPDAARLGTLEAIQTAIGVIAEAGPVVVAMEDLQWSDPSTLEVLARLHRVASERPLCLVGTVRADGEQALTGLLDEIAGSGSDVTTLMLAPLERDDERQLLQLLSAAELPPDAEEAILAASEGVPLYLREFARSLEEGGGAQPPPTLDRLILARLDRLANDEREVVTAVSVLGRTIDPALAELVAPHPELERILDSLVDRGILDRHARGFSFSHALIGEVAYGTLLRRRRRDLHRSVALHLEEQEDDDETVAALAYHWEQAGEDLSAGRYPLLAADRAEEVSALREALVHVDAACRLAGSTEPPGPDLDALILRRAKLRARTGATALAREDAERALASARERRDRHAEVLALQELGFILSGAVDYREATPLFDEALNLAEILGDRVEQVHAHAHLSIAWTNRLRFDRGLVHGQLAADLAASIGDASVEVVALDALKQVELELGDFDRAEEHIRRIVAICEGHEELWPIQIAMLELGMIAQSRGRAADARRHLERSLDINDRLGDHGTRPLLLALVAWLDRQAGRYREAIGGGGHALRLAEDHGHQEWIAWSSIVLGSTLAEIGDLDAAARTFGEGARASEAAGADLEAVRCLAGLGRAHLGLGDLTAAGAAHGEASHLFSRIVVPDGRAYVLAWDAYADAAVIEATLDGPEHARRWIDDVTEVAERSGFLEAVAGGRLVQGRIERLRGEPGAARSLFEEALATATVAQAPGIGWRASAALASLDAGRAEGADHAATARSVVDRLLVDIDDAHQRQALSASLERELAGEPD